MFNVLAASYMTAARMDHFLEQDFMHRPPREAARLRRIHGLDDPSMGRQLRGRIGMDGAIERARTPSRIAQTLRAAVAVVGTGLRRAGTWLEDAASTSYRTEVTP